MHPFIEIVKSRDVEKVEEYLMRNEMLPFDVYIEAICVARPTTRQPQNFVRDFLMNFNQYAAGGISEDLMFTLCKAEDGGINEIQLLSKLKPEDMNMSYSCSVTLQLAARLGYFEVIKQYYPKLESLISELTEFANKMKNTQNLDESTISGILKQVQTLRWTTGYIFCLAVQNGHLNIIEWLYGQYPKMDEILRMKNDTPLFLAAIKGQLQVMKWLYQKGGNIHALNDRCTVIAAQYGNLELLMWLQENRADILNEDYHPFRVASLFGHLHIMNWLFDKGAATKDLLAEAVFVAASHGYIEVLKWLQKKGFDVRARNDKALLLACEYGHLPALQWLHAQGCELNVQNAAGLLLACKNGHLSIVQWFAEQGVNVISPQNDLPFLSAIVGGQLAVMQWMYEQGRKEQPLVANMLFLAAQLGHLPVVQWLVAQGVNFRVENNRAFYLAVQGDCLDIVQWLAGQDVNVRGEDDRPLFLAIRHGSLSVVKWLVEQGVNIRIENDRALFVAAHYGQLPIMQWLAQQGFNIRAQNNRALLLAAQHGHLDVVQWLVGQGADIHRQNNEALRLAAVNHRLAVVCYIANIVGNIPDGIIAGELNRGIFHEKLDYFIDESKLKNLENRLGCYNNVIQLIDEKLVARVADRAECDRLNLFKAEVVLGREKIEAKIASKLLDYKMALFYKMNPDNDMFNIRKGKESSVLNLPDVVLNKIMASMINTTQSSTNAICWRANSLSGATDKAADLKIQKQMDLKRALEPNAVEDSSLPPAKRSKPN